ncbi:hypothetical protein BBW65_03955 [Helicobacter enhydrae]|uniref:Acyltransferase n=2 Tax=Helicobacter enhydrae TaxID=222136 RepID=A0A1B1U7K3_9HELI|nr:hypothetical protein BBW65_03955 [Helicobacter enhydrae]
MQSQNNCGFYTQNEIQELGFVRVGKNVLISKNAKIYGASKISIGSNVRIDDFCILSGRIEIGDFVHLGASSNITGSDVGVIIKDFCSISSHVRIFAISDDYTGEGMTNPCIPNHFKQIQKQRIILEKHCIIGSGSMIIPKAYLAEGVAVGAMSLLVRETKPWGVYFGIPAKRIKERKKDILQLEQEFLKTQNIMGGGDRQIISPSSKKVCA